MKTLISIVTFAAFLSISGCYADPAKETDGESAEQNTTPASHPASSRY